VSEAVAVDPAVAWFAGLCDRRDREDLATPLTLDVDGEAWTLATNGHVMAMTRGEYGYPRPEDPAKFLAVVQKKYQTEPVAISMNDLRAIMPPVVDIDTLPPCEECENTGRITCDDCDGDGVLECMCHCGDDHDKTCGECDGDGWVSCECGRDPSKAEPPIERVQIGASHFNRLLLAKAIPHLPDAPATWQSDTPEGQAWLTVGGYRVLFMPMRQFESDTATFFVPLAVALPEKEASKEGEK
jgi:hypothetical protein